MKLIKGLILLILIVVLIVFILQNILPFFLKDTLVNKLNRLSKGQLDIANFSLDLFAGIFQVEDISWYRGLRPDEFLKVSLDKLRIRFNLLEIWKKNIVIEKIICERPLIQLRRHYRKKVAEDRNLLTALNPTLAIPLFYKLLPSKAEGKEVSSSPETPAGFKPTNVSKYLPPFTVKYLEVRNAHFRLVDIFGQAQEVVTELENYNLKLRNIKYPMPVEELLTSFELFSTVKATQLGSLRAYGITNPFYKEGNFDLDLELKDIYIPHFKNYLFKRKSIEVREGKASLLSKASCRENFLRSQNKLILSKLEVVSLLPKVENGEEILKFFNLPTRLFANFLNNATKEDLIFDFELNTDITKPDFKSGKLIRELFIKLLQKEISRTLQQTPGGLGGLLDTFVSVPKETATRVIGGDTKSEKTSLNLKEAATKFEELLGLKNKE